MSGGDFDEGMAKVISKQVRTLFQSIVSTRVDDLPKLYENIEENFLKTEDREASTKRNFLDSIEKFIRFVLVKKLAYFTTDQGQCMISLTNGWKKALRRRITQRKHIVKRSERGNISFYISVLHVFSLFISLQNCLIKISCIRTVLIKLYMVSSHPYYF